MEKDFLSDFLDLNGDGHVTPQEAYIGLQFLETALHWEPERWDEDGFFDDAADMDDGEGDGFDDFDDFDSFDEDDGFDDEIDRDGF